MSVEYISEKARHANTAVGLSKACALASGCDQWLLISRRGDDDPVLSFQNMSDEEFTWFVAKLSDYAEDMRRGDV